MSESTDNNDTPIVMVMCICAKGFPHPIAEPDPRCPIPHDDRQTTWDKVRELPDDFLARQKEAQECSGLIWQRYDWTMQHFSRVKRFSSPARCRAWWGENVTNLADADAIVALARGYKGRELSIDWLAGLKEGE